VRKMSAKESLQMRVRLGTGYDTPGAHRSIQAAEELLQEDLLQKRVRSLLQRSDFRVSDSN